MQYCNKKLTIGFHRIMSRISRQGTRTCQHVRRREIAAPVSFCPTLRCRGSWGSVGQFPMNYVPSDIISAGYIRMLPYYTLCYQRFSGVLRHLNAAIFACCYAIYYAFTVVWLKTACRLTVWTKSGAKSGSTAGLSCLITIPPAPPATGPFFVRGGGVKNGLYGIF